MRQIKMAVWNVTKWGAALIVILFFTDNQDLMKGHGAKGGLVLMLTIVCEYIRIVGVYEPSKAEFEDASR